MSAALQRFCQQQQEEFAEYLYCACGRCRYLPEQPRSVQTVRQCGFSARMYVYKFAPQWWNFCPGCGTEIRSTSHD